MTLDLDAIRGRCDAATEGPWIRYGVRHKMGNESGIAVGPDGKPGPIAFLPIGSQQRDKYHAEALRDGEFIAHARTDIPALLAVIDGLAKALEPFARAAQHITEEFSDLDSAEFALLEQQQPTVGDLRNAAAQLAALARKGEQP